MAPYKGYMPRNLLILNIVCNTLNVSVIEIINARTKTYFFLNQKIHKPHIEFISKHISRKLVLQYSVEQHINFKSDMILQYYNNILCCSLEQLLLIISDAILMPSVIVT